MPEGETFSFYLDSPINKASQFETYIAKEVIGKIDQTYRTVARKKSRVISGLSMGGHGALYLSGRHPELFAAAGSISALIELYMDSLSPIPAFSGLRSGEITLRLLNDDNVPAVLAELRGLPDEADLREEIQTNYMPTYWHGRRSNFGFAAYLHGELAGFSLLSVDDWYELSGSTGADTLLHMRGRGVAPGSKPHLFYLAFQLLGLHRVETGHRISNVASQRSIQKTPGFVLEGRSRESGRNEAGEFEDELLYGILRREWQHLYDPAAVEVLL